MSQPPQPPAGRPGPSRGNPAVGDIVRSVLALAVVLLVVVWAAGLFRSETVVEPATVDYRAVAEQAAGQATYPLLVPSNLPDGWRATQAEWNGSQQRWHLGLLTADDHYVGLDQQRDISIDDLVTTYATANQTDGEVDVGGHPWRVFVDADHGRTALAEQSAGVTTMVLGSAPMAQLIAFAAGLAPFADARGPRPFASGGR